MDPLDSMSTLVAAVETGGLSAADREVRLDNGWVVKIGRGLDFYQKPEGWSAIGATDLSLRRCLETKIDVYIADLRPIADVTT